jgi:glutamate dehydrogenase (NADP+)
MSIKQIKDYLERFHQGDNEFHAAVTEVAEDVLIPDDDYSFSDLQDAFFRIMEPDRTVKFKVEWFDDKDQIQVNHAWRVQFNNCLGPYKGGLRFHPSVNDSILKFLGFEQIFKNALTGLPMGGAKGGSDFNPKGKSEGEIRRFCQSFMTELYTYIGPDKDIPAGDIGVGGREIGYLFGQFLQIKGRHEGIITGKGISFGGSEIREEATGYGAVYFLNEALKAHDRELKGKRVLVSGSGNVALYAVEKLLDKEATTLTVSDSGGTLFFKDGITRETLEKLKTYKFQDRKRLKDFECSDSEFFKDEKPWQFDAEIAMPCATQNEIDEKDAKNLLKIKDLVIAEGANMPLTEKAIQLVVEKNIIYLPGKATNAGGVAVSGLERSQNATYDPMTAEEVDSELKNIMKTIHTNCTSTVNKKDGIYPYKRGANKYAFLKVREALIQLRGESTKGEQS